MMWETGVSVQTVNIPLRWFIYITQWALTYSSHRLLNSLGSLAEARLCDSATHYSYLFNPCQNSVNSTLAYTQPVGIVVLHAFVFLSSLF